MLVDAATTQSQLVSNTVVLPYRRCRECGACSVSPCNPISLIFWPQLVVLRKGLDYTGYGLVDSKLLKA